MWPNLYLIRLSVKRRFNLRRFRCSSRSRTTNAIERCFLDDTGMSVGEWRRRFRMFHAMRLLEGGASVTDTAFDVGYRSVSAFTVAFTRHFGASPSRRR